MLSRMSLPHALDVMESSRDTSARCRCDQKCIKAGSDRRASQVKLQW